MDHKLITVVTAESSANKHYTIGPDGDLHKERPYQTACRAQTISIPSLSALQVVLSAVADNPNQYVILGFIPGSSEYQILSRVDMANAFGNDGAGLQQAPDGKFYAARLKVNFKQSSITMFDRDEVFGMPDALVFTDFEGWWRAMCSWIPGLADCGYLRTSSNSARVLRDGEPLAIDNDHVYIEVADPADVDRFGKAALIQSFSHGAGFMRPIFKKGSTQKIGQRPWTMFDPTVFSRERVDYAGAPTVDGPGLSVVPKRFDLNGGGLLDTALMLTPARGLQKALGLDLTQNKAGGWGLTDNTSLTPDIEIDTQEHGPMSVQQYIDSKLGKLRCQAVFRPDSDSMAAYLNRYKDGQIFLFDVGTQTKFLLNNSAEAFAAVAEAMAQPAAGEPAAGEPAAGEPAEAPSSIDDLIDATRFRGEDEDESSHYATCIALIKLIIQDDTLTRIERRLDAMCTNMALGPYNKNGRSLFNDMVKEARESNNQQLSASLAGDGPNGERFLIDNIVTITGNSRYYNLRIREEITSAAALDSTYAHLFPEGETPSDVLARSSTKKTAQGLGWMPTDERMFSYSGLLYVNTYKPPSMIPEANEFVIQDWLVLCLFVYGEQLDLVLDHMAFTLQYPNTKIRWQVLAHGGARTGKDLSVEPLMQILGDGAGEITNDNMKSGWGDYYLEKKLVKYVEVKSDEEKADAHFNSMKSIFADSGMMSLNIKGCRTVGQLNRLSCYLFSNFDAPLKFDIDQDKLLVVRVPNKPMAKRFYTQLGKRIENNTNGINNAIYHYLLNRDVTEFEYGTLPLRTDALFAMCLAAEADGLAAIKEASHDRLGVFSLSILQFGAVRKWLRDNRYFDLKRDKDISTALQAAGWVKVIGEREINGDRKRTPKFWARKQFVKGKTAGQIYDYFNKHGVEWISQV